MTSREVAALVKAYGRAVREHTPPSEMREVRDRVIRAMAEAGVGQRYAPKLELYARASRRQADTGLTLDQRAAAGRDADEIAAGIEVAAALALGEPATPEPAPDGQ